MYFPETQCLIEWQSWHCSMLIRKYLATGELLPLLCYHLLFCRCGSYCTLKLPVKRLLILWCWLNWKLPHCRRILFPDIRNAVTFSLPTFTWLILTAVHGAAWCHLQALPSRVRPCTYTLLEMSVVRWTRHSPTVIQVDPSQQASNTNDYPS